MNDERLASAVSDWLKESDTPPRDSRSAVAWSVARAGKTRRARRSWPVAWSVGGQIGRWRVARISGAAVLVILVIGAALLRGGSTTPEAEERLPSGRHR